MIRVEVPAEITSLENKVFGNLSLKQLIFFTAPALAIIFSFTILPTVLKYDLYKLVIAIVTGIPMAIMGIRVDKILIVERLALIVSYHIRPHRFISNKNSVESRTPMYRIADNPTTSTSTDPIEKVPPNQHQFYLLLDTSRTAEIDLAHKKGRTHAYYTEKD